MVSFEADNRMGDVAGLQFLALIRIQGEAHRGDCIL